MPRRTPPPKPQRRPKGTGTLTILASGTIRARLPASLDPQRRAKEFRPGQRAEAEAWLDSYLSPATTIAAAMTVGDWIGHWHATYVQPIRPPSTTRRVLHSLKQLAPLFTVLVADVRPSALQQVVGTLTARLAPETVQGIVGDWRRCFEAAVDDELLTRNPAKRLIVPRIVPKDAKRHVTPAEVALVWPAIAGHRFEAAYALLLGCGLRIGEVLGLHWSNVDLGNRRAWIQHQWTDARIRDVPKGRNPHWVTLPGRVIAALIRHRNGQAEGAILVMQSPHANLYGPGKPPRRADRRPRPWAAQTVRRDLLAIVAALELDPLTPHAFRRGLVTALLDGGASPAVVAERVGHRNTATTLNSYAMRSESARKQADDLVDAYLGHEDVP